MPYYVGTHEVIEKHIGTVELVHTYIGPTVVPEPVPPTPPGEDGLLLAGANTVLSASSSSDLSIENTQQILEDTLSGEHD